MSYKNQFSKIEISNCLLNLLTKKDTRKRYKFILGHLQDSGDVYLPSAAIPSQSKSSIGKFPACIGRKVSGAAPDVESCWHQVEAELQLASHLSDLA